MDDEWIQHLKKWFTSGLGHVVDEPNVFFCNLKNRLPCAGEDEATEKDDINAKEESEPPHKKNKKHRKHKSKKKKRRKKGEKDTSSESGAESDVEPPPAPRPVRTTRARSELKIKMNWTMRTTSLMNIFTLQKFKTLTKYGDIDI